ncbi:MAG: glycosyl hydrolase, partial [Gemmatimonadota bacterium]
SVGAVGVCEANPDVVYIGMGETELRGNVQSGDGAYKTTDGGETWEHIGLDETQNISRIRVHPTDCNTAWAGGFGIFSTDNPERGVYKTTDGGETWRLVLHKSPKAGAVDISVHPGNPDIVYAAIWEAWRKSWGMSSGGPDSGLWRSLDGGETWTDISRNTGLPQEGVLGKIGVAVSPANPDRVYAIIEHADAGGVYTSTDGGETWSYQNEERRLRQRAFYYTRIYADPLEEETVYVLNTGAYQSKDAGETFDRQYRVPHGDNHDLWIAPSDNQRMANANDGGGNVSFNGGDTWTDQDFPTAQFYRVITTAHEPYWICGAQQDNSTACMPSSGWGHLAARGGGDYFTSVGGCESGYIAPHPVNTDLYYAGCYGGSLSRYDHSSGLTRQVNVWPENPMGQSSEDLDERVQWTFPIVFSHHDPNVLYTGTQKVWRTGTEGQNWEQISPDLTRADPSTIGPSGGPITLDQTGVETYATVFSIAPSYHDPNVIWAGSDDGYVHVTRNAQDANPGWTNVTPPDAPDFVRINTIEASPHTPGKAYVAGLRELVENDRSPYIWVTEDYGQSWEKRVNGIPYGDFVRAVREDPIRAGLLYAATERGVYVSWDDGANWQSLSQNLPVVQVSDLVVEDNDLVIGTHGRSFWVMEDIGVLRQLTPSVASAEAYLFDPKDPVRGFDNFVTLEYRLAEDADNVRIEFLDAQGNVLSEYEASSDDEVEEEDEEDNPFRRFFGGGASDRPPLEAGTNQFNWSMRTEGWTDFDGRIFWAAGNVGPAVLPGRYTARLTVDGETMEQDFEIRMNPRAVEDGVTLADLEERFRFATELRDRVSQANEAVIRIRDLKGEVDDRLERSDNGELEALGEEVNTKLTDVEGEIYQFRSQSNQDPLNFPIKINNKLAALLNQVEGSETRPTDQSYEVYEQLSGELDTEMERLQIIIQQDVRRLNDLLRDLGLPPIDTERLIT